MKQPDHICYDEFHREMRRGKTPDEARGVALAALFFHLVDQLRWHPQEAANLMVRFNAAFNDPRPEPDLREKLRGVWTDHSLSKGRAARCGP